MNYWVIHDGYEYANMADGDWSNGRPSGMDQPFHDLEKARAAAAEDFRTNARVVVEVPADD